MTSYTVSTTAKSDRATSITGTLDDIRARLLIQATKEDWSLDGWESWAAGKDMPALTTGSLREFVADMWQVTSQQVNITESLDIGSIDALSINLASKLGITFPKAYRIAEGYLGDLEAKGGRAIDRMAIAPQDFGYVLQEARKAQRAGKLGQSEMQTLAEVMAEINVLNERLDALLNQRNSAMLDAKRAGAKSADIAKLAQVTVSRVNQLVA